MGTPVAGRVGVAILSSLGFGLHLGLGFGLGMVHRIFAGEDGRRPILNVRWLGLDLLHLHLRYRCARTGQP
ncbi:MAG: hypothetical protein AB4911_20910 [Oscillochloridaceae bacterium umkhey_bin13]